MWKTLRFCEMLRPSTTKLFVPKDGFPIFLNLIYVQGHMKTDIDAFYEATTDDYLVMGTIHCLDIGSV